MPADGRPAHAVQGDRPYLTLARQAIRESHDGLNVLARKNGIDLRADYPFGGK